MSTSKSQFKPMNLSLSIIIPFFNEEVNMGNLIEDLQNNHGNCECTFLFVDDGSTDSSVEILERSFRLTAERYKLIRHATNSGKASAVSSAIKSCETSHFVILDADLELKSAEVHKMWNLVQSRLADSVFGVRSFRSHNSFTYRYTIGNKFLSHWFSMWFNVVISDVMCGLKLVPTQLFKDEILKAKKFAVEVEIPTVLWMRGLVPYELNVDYEPRGWTEGKVIGVRDAIYILVSVPLFRMQLRKQRPRFFKRRLDQISFLEEKY